MKPDTFRKIKRYGRYLRPVSKILTSVDYVLEKLLDSVGERLMKIYWWIKIVH